ncbi:coiled-coil domain-containing protein 177 [Penaeus vannamei]|uniref:coiled-coil domain-containing protein 177 n=1 Tax=Penaeus vannamei TaxID=6689 RepID=UPI00387F70F1
MKDPGVKLDLYNYDLPQYESCPYILTSPRSLEACKRLGIKPVELLQKSREEFQAAHPEMSLEEALVAFHRQERNRLKRLREARDLRDRLLVAEERRARQEASGAGPSRADASPPPPARRTPEEGEKGEQETSEQEKEEGEEEEEEEESKESPKEAGGSRSSSPPSLARKESEGSSFGSASSKEQKEQENFARSLVQRQASSSSWEDAEKRDPGKDDEGAAPEARPRGTEGAAAVSPRKREGATAGASRDAVDSSTHDPGPPPRPDPRRAAPSPAAARRASRTGGPRPSSAQRARQGTHKPPFDLTPKVSAAKDAPEVFTRVPGAPYRAASSPKPAAGAKRARRPASATPKSSSGLLKASAGGALPAKHLTFKGIPGAAPTGRAASLRPASASQAKLLNRGSGTWPGKGAPSSRGRDAAPPHAAPHHRPRITWASPAARRQGHRRSSDSTTSLASSASEGGGGGVADLLLEPPGTESDEGPPSANSAAECDRLPSGAAARPERRLASPCRLEPRLPTVGVVSPGGRWSPRSDSTTLTPVSTPRLPRRRLPTPARTPCPKTPTRRRPGVHRRVSSARPARSNAPPIAVSFTGSLDEIAGTRAERGAALGLGGGSCSLELPRPHSAASSVASSSCATYRTSRPASGLARTRPSRRPASALGHAPHSDSWSPRLLPNHRSISTVSLADSQILSRFMDGLENTEVPARDLRILEMLARKHEKLFAEEQRSHLAHRAWHQQKERERKEAAAQWAEWRAHVNEKRRQENDENERRWRRNQEVYRQSQEKLARLIYGKERRALEVLGEQQDARMRRLGERRAAEASRKAAQEEALRAKEEAEERKRQHLIQLWERQQQLVEQRRREREEFFRKRVEDGNSAEAERNEARRVQVEARAEALLEAMRHNMEERLSRAEHNLRMLNEVKEDTLRRQRDERGRRRMAVRALHHQLEASMLQWRQHVLRRLMESLAKAETRQEEYLQTRANRIHHDRTARMNHQHEMMQMVMAREEAELQMAKRSLEAKDLRSLEVARERDRQVALARSTALTTASLRENLRKKLAPETFDKVVARANLELRIENRPPATSSVGTRSHIFLG